MRSEKTIWRFWAIASVLIGIAWALMAFSIASDYSPFPAGLAVFLIGSYLIIAVICLLAARFQIYELRADAALWERNDARIRKWTQAIFGASFVAGALEKGSKLLPGRGGPDSPLSFLFLMVFNFCVGIYFIRHAFKIRQTGAMND